MNKRVKRLWLDALRSGEYKQAQGRLRKDLGGSSYYCCLGVLCDLYIKDAPLAGARWEGRGSVRFFVDGDRNQSTNYLVSGVVKWAGLEDRGGQVWVAGVSGVSGVSDDLASLNDKRMPFDKIADIIEREL